MLYIEGIMCNGQKRRKKTHGGRQKKIPVYKFLWRNKARMYYLYIPKNIFLIYMANKYSNMYISYIQINLTPMLVNTGTSFTRCIRINSLKIASGCF